MSVEERALGMIECNSLSRGAVVVDSMLKTARVTLLFAQPVPPGRLLVAVSGDVAAVESAVENGLELAGASLEDALFIPRLHAQVLDFLHQPATARTDGALGMIETRTVAAAIRAADAALKSARVALVSLHLGRHIGGRGMIHLVGDVADVQAAVDAGRTAVRLEELEIDHAVIARPHPDYLSYMSGGPGVARPLPGVLVDTGEAS